MILQEKQMILHHEISRLFRENNNFLSNSTHQKYLKYKQKYLQLKKILTISLMEYL